MTKSNGKSDRGYTYVLDRVEGLGVGCSVFSAMPHAHYGFRYNNACDARSLLNSAEIMRVAPAHRRILMRLVMCQTTGAPEVVLRGPEGLAIVREIVATGLCYWTDAALGPLRWAEQPRAAAAVWQRYSDERQCPMWHVTPPADFVLALTPPVFVDLKRQYCGPLAGNLPEALAAKWTGTPAMDHAACARFCQDVANWFPEVDIPTPEPLPVRTAEDVAPTPCVTILQRPFNARSGACELARVLVLRLEFDYAGQRVHHAARGDYVSQLFDGGIRRLKRDGAAEQAAVRRLTDCGFCPLFEALPGHDVRAYEHDLTLPPGEGAGWGRILQTVLPELENEGWRIDRDAGLRLLPIGDEDWYAAVQSKGSDWFEFEAGIECEGRRLNMLPAIHELLRRHRGKSLEQIERGLRRQATVLPVGPGTVAVIAGNRLFTILRSLFELFDSAPLQQNERLRMNLWRVAELAEMEKVAASGWHAPGRIRKLADRLRKMRSLVPREPPAGFTGTLRPYQQLGFAWLQFLREQEFDGILADDMGLGKTVQTLAHLLEEKRHGRLEGGCLIVAPTSVLNNWTEEARRFAPELRTLLLHGPDRKDVFEQIPDADLIVTSYALLRRDVEAHLRVEFAYIILDEAQFIKNHRAQTARIVRDLKSRRRLCLTGTPMENHLGELWALFHFLMPGFLGTQQAFNTQFRGPVEKQGNSRRARLLSRRVAPFLMRRTKQAVEKDLPPKTEIVHSLELTERQRDMYESVRLAMQTKIRNEIRRKGLARSQITILHALLRLRQICCDPRLADKNGESAEREHSCKLAALLDMVPEMVEEGRRILIFSQFVKMLKLIEQEVRQAGIEYVRLTGATRDRTAPIRRFQNGEAPLFLISLKAGGTGLNLTAADTVIHYDPWWNPAVERQATDRAHRIGQDKPVFVYKMLTDGTVESKILELQRRKSELADGVLREGASAKLQLDKNDLDQLFAPIR